MTKTIQYSNNPIKYESEVREAAESWGGDTIFNDGFDCAKILSHRLVDNANDVLCLFSSELRSDLYDSETTIAKYVTFCRKTGSKLKVLLRSDFPMKRESKFVSRIFFSGLYPNAELRVLSESTPVSDFCVIDNSISGEDRHKAFRFETDKKELQAVACFGDSDGYVERMQVAFNTLWAGAEQVAPSEYEKHLSKDG